MGGLLDSIGEGAKDFGYGALGLLGTIGEAYLAAKAPAMYSAITENRNRGRNQKDREVWANQMQGLLDGEEERNNAPDAFSMGEAQLMDQLNPADDFYNPAVKPGSFGQIMAKMGMSPDAVNRVGGAKMITDRYAPRTAQQRNRQFITTGTEDGRGRQQMMVNPETGALTAAGPSWRQQAATRIDMNLNNAAQPVTPTTAGDNDPFFRKGTRYYTDPKTGVPKEIKAKGLTEGQAKANTYAIRQKQANTELTDLKDSGFDSTSVGTAMGVTALEMGGPAAYMVGEDTRRYYQAMQNWGSANLRDETGAVLGADEMKQQLEQYFPRAGATDAMVEQKARTRAAAEKGMREKAGIEYKMPTKQELDARPKPTNMTEDQWGRYKAYVLDGTINEDD